MPELTFDRYYRYDDLTEILNGLVSAHPRLATIESIGKSYEGRDIWVVTLTNQDTGPASEKPAFWVDANIHATEVSGSSAALYLINLLLATYGKVDEHTRLLDTRALYVCPRVSPDGAEMALADTPRMVRSGPRLWPFPEDPIEGLDIMDIDGDGRMLQMRIEDPNGQWKAHADEPRLMVKRDPGEEGDTYYRISYEGRVAGYDGLKFEYMPVKEGLDFNRNFANNWRVEKEQAGAGPYPTSEPETRALAQFITAHPNITGATEFHTFSGVLLRPYSGQADDAFAAEDLWVYNEVGQKGTELTGYPNLNINKDFRYHPKQVLGGDSAEWLFDHVGVFIWAPEIWSIQQQAGVEIEHFIDWYRSHPVEDDLKMLAFSDEKLGGKGYIDWYAFDHPELGPVELGGWDFAYAWRNPPPEFLEAEIAPLVDWVIWQARISPRLELIGTDALPLGDGRYRLRLDVQNTGWLPTYVTKKAVEKGLSRGLLFEIELPAGAELLTGKEREAGGELEGRAYHGSTATPWATMAHPLHGDRTRHEWVVSAPAGSTVTLTARHDRAGTVRASISL